MLDGNAEVEVDIENTTFGDLEDVERSLGRPILNDFQAGRMDAATMRAVVAVNLRKRDPTITDEDVRNLRIVQVVPAPSADEAAAPAVDPTPASADVSAPAI